MPLNWRLGGPSACGPIREMVLFHLWCERLAGAQVVLFDLWSGWLAAARCCSSLFVASPLPHRSRPSFSLLLSVSICLFQCFCNGFAPSVYFHVYCLIVASLLSLQDYREHPLNPALFAWLLMGSLIVASSFSL